MHYSLAREKMIEHLFTFHNIWSIEQNVHSLAHLHIFQKFVHLELVITTFYTQKFAFSSFVRQKDDVWKAEELILQNRHCH